MRSDIGLLVLRLGAGGLLAVMHGLPKAMGFTEKATSFADPMGLGPTVSLVMAIFGELICGSLVAAGLFTRLAAIPPLITMTVAALVVHRMDPFSRKELAIIYGVCFLAILLTGPGRFSLDSVMRKAKFR